MGAKVAPAFRIDLRRIAMKTAYPVIFTLLDDGWYLVDIPDLDGRTQGENYHDAIHMARDLIGQLLLDMEDSGQECPPSTPMSKIDVSKGRFASEGAGEVSMVDIDTTEYRRAVDTANKRSVRRNITLPAWLDHEAKKAKVNVSKIAQKALISELGL